VDGNNERLLTPGEVAALFRVDPKTVTRWAASGRITSIRTPGGHRRFRESEVRALLRGESEASPEGHPAVLSRGLPGKSTRGTHAGERGQVRRMAWHGDGESRAILARVFTGGSPAVAAFPVVRAAQT
jgi:excisionase family DNA binding protein